jgi:hypothetical protein
MDALVGDARKGARAACARRAVYFTCPSGECAAASAACVWLRERALIERASERGEQLTSAHVLTSAIITFIIFLHRIMS